jgi:hypothetical protein
MITFQARKDFGFYWIVHAVRLVGTPDMLEMMIGIHEDPAQPVAGANRRCRGQFRSRGSRRESAVAQLFSLGITTLMDEISPEDYERLVDKLTKQAAADFRQASQSIQEQRQACCRYFKRGELADISQPELVDFLGVSTPSVLEMAGYSDADAQRVMEMIADISDDEIQKIVI